MRTLGNILWHFPFFGFVQAALTWLLGLVLTITVIAAPIGRGLMEYGKFLFAPFSKAMVSRSALNEKQNEAWKAYSMIVTVIYIPLGLVLAVIAVFQIAGLFVSIAGIPMAIVLAKSLGTFFNPVNKKCVPRAVADEIERRAAAGAVGRHLATFLGSAVLIASAGTSAAQTVDFEMIPGQGTPVDNQLISAEFEADFGVTFVLLENDRTPADPSIGPRIAKVGGAKTAFVGTVADPTCDSIGATTNDTVTNLARSGCWILTDDGVHPGPRPFGLLIEYSAPVLQAGGELIDVDGGPEAWRITALDSLGAAIVHAANPVLIEYLAYPGADDGDFAQFSFDLGQPIHAIELIYTGEASFGRGLAFDNFSPASLPTGAPEGNQEGSWGQSKGRFR